MLYEEWIMHDRGESRHRPEHDHKLHQRHAKLLPEFLEKEPKQWTSSEIYWYEVNVIQMCYKCYMRHGSHQTGVNHPLEHIMSSIYTPDLIISYPGLQVESAITIYIISDVGVQGR